MKFFTKNTIEDIKKEEAEITLCQAEIAFLTKCLELPALYHGFLGRSRRSDQNSIASYNKLIKLSEELITCMKEDLGEK